MSDQTDFETHLSAIQAIAKEETKTCPMPIDIYASEATVLYHWCQADRAQMEAMGLNAALIDGLLTRAGALVYAEALWQAEYQMRKDVAEQWAQQSPIAYALRDELLRTFRLAYRKQPELLKQVSKIAEGESNADMIQDLAELSVLGKQHSEALEAMVYDMSQLDIAAELAGNMRSLLGKANGEHMSANESRALRDQAYTYLKEAVDEVRAFGKYVNYDNEERLKGYGSSFYRYRSRKEGSNSEQSEHDTTEA